MIPVLPFSIPLATARLHHYPEYTFVAALTAGKQKGAFWVKNRLGRDLCLKIVVPDCDRSGVAAELRAPYRVRDTTASRAWKELLRSLLNSDPTLRPRSAGVVAIVLRELAGASRKVSEHS